MRLPSNCLRYVAAVHYFLESDELAKKLMLKYEDKLISKGTIMNRSTLDKLVSSVGLVIAVVLLIAAGGLFYTYTFIHSQVRDQLAQQKITFPAPNSDPLNALPDSDKQMVAKYAGQQLLTGAQAKVFADNYIAVHLEKVSGGKTYAEASTLSLANPSDTKLAAQVQTLFRGETLRGLLLNAYAFDTMAIVAQYAALFSLLASILLLILVALGFRHAESAKPIRKTQVKKRT